MSVVHEVKAWPQNFQQLKANERTFDVRKNDRGYLSGDSFFVHEFEPDSGSDFDNPSGRFTGEKARRRINRVFENVPGVRPGYVVLALDNFIER